MYRAVNLEPEHLKTVLVNARNKIAEHGWCQGKTKNEVGCYCIVGSIIYAGLEINPKITSVIHETDFVLQVNKIDERTYSLAKWNDEPGRTKEEVIAALDKAIANCP